jgi:glycosyltransferase involved in cell wall biosynthesis
VQRPLRVVAYVERYLQADQTFVYRQMRSLPTADVHLVSRYLVPNCVYPLDRVRLFGGPERKTRWLGHKLNRLRQRMLGTYTWLSWSEGVRLRRILEELRPDIVHAHWAPDAMQVAGACRQLQLPLIVQFHGYDASRLIRDEVYRRHLGRLFRQMRLALTVSEEMRTRVIGLGCPPERAVSHHIGVPEEFFLPARPAKAAGGSFALVHVGRLDSTKGHAVAIAAFVLARRQVPGLRMRLVGDGPLRSEIAAQIERENVQDVVTLVGRRPPAEVIEEMRKADALILPCIRGRDGGIEGLPIVAMEGMAAGLPVISTRHGGIPEAVRYGRREWLVEENDVPGLAERIVALASSAELWATLSAEGRQIARRDFHLPTQNARLEQIYRSLLPEML